VTAKALVIEAIQKLPEESTLADIREQIEFMAGVREGLDASRRGEVISLEEVEKKIAEWASPS
jgi:predicted transcriptional regulator